MTFVDLIVLFLAGIFFYIVLNIIIGFVRGFVRGADGVIRYWRHRR